MAGWHTAGINIVGSFILGGVFATPLSNATKQMQASKVVQHQPKAKIVPNVPQGSAINGSMNSLFAMSMSPRMKLLVGVGFCGSFSKSF